MAHTAHPNHTTTLLLSINSSINSSNTSATSSRAVLLCSPDTPCTFIYPPVFRLRVAYYRSFPQAVLPPPKSTVRYVVSARVSIVLCHGPGMTVPTLKELRVSRPCILQVPLRPLIADTGIVLVLIEYLSRDGSSKESTKVSLQKMGQRGMSIRQTQRG